MLPYQAYSGRPIDEGPINVTVVNKAKTVVVAMSQKDKLDKALCDFYEDLLVCIKLLGELNNIKWVIVTVK